MRRDWELIRRILLTLEEQETAHASVSPVHFPDTPAERVSYHIKLLIDAGYVEGTCNRSAPLFCMARTLTLAGHEFLDQTRSSTVWNRTLKLLQEKGVDLSFETIKLGVGHVLAEMLK